MEKEQVNQQKSSSESEVRKLTLKQNYIKLDKIYGQLCDLLSPEDEFGWEIARSITRVLDRLDILISEAEAPGDE